MKYIVIIVMGVLSLSVTQHASAQQYAYDRYSIQNYRDKLDEKSAQELIWQISDNIDPVTAEKEKRKVIPFFKNKYRPVVAKIDDVKSVIAARKAQYEGTELKRLSNYEAASIVDQCKPIYRSKEYLQGVEVYSVDVNTGKVINIPHEGDSQGGGWVMNHPQYGDILVLSCGNPIGTKQVRQGGSDYEGVYTPGAASAGRTDGSDPKLERRVSALEEDMVDVKKGMNTLAGMIQNSKNETLAALNGLRTQQPSGHQCYPEQHQCPNRNAGYGQQNGTMFLQTGYRPNTLDYLEFGKNTLFEGLAAYNDTRLTNAYVNALNTPQYVVLGGGGPDDMYYEGEQRPRRRYNYSDLNSTPGLNHQMGSLANIAPRRFNTTSLSRR